jgi:opacity protein-like surface antigen
MRFIFAFVTGALLAASPAMAAEDSGFYIGAGLGNFALSSEGIDIDYGDLQVNTGRDFDGSDFAFKILGGWQLNKYIAFEAEYFDGGTPDDKFNFSYDDGEVAADGQLTIEADTTGWVLSALGIWPFGESFNVFAKLGFVMWDVEGKLRIKGSGTDLEGPFDFNESASLGSEDGTDFAWGVGGTWNITDNMGLRAEYQQFEISDFNSVDLVTASFIYKF